MESEKTMKYFLRWAQVQQQLMKHVQATGTPYSFFDAVRELWEEGRFQRGKALPTVRFQDWDCADLTQLEALLDQVPVDLGDFCPDFADGHAALPSMAAHINHLNIAPCRIARYQAQGIHTHEFFEIDYVVCGTARLNRDGAIRILPEGSLCLISPNFAHDAMAGDDCILLSITLSSQNVEHTLSRFLRRESLVSDFFRFGFQSPRCGYLLFHEIAPGTILPLVRELLHEFYNGEEFFRDTCANYLELLLLRVLRQSGERYEQITSEGSGKHGTFPILAILKYIQDNYASVSLSETARHFHYDPVYLGKKIRAYTGKNYRELVGGLRMETACGLLRASDLSIENVAKASGFDDPAHFSKTFHKQYGVSPTIWRQSAL